MFDYSRFDALRASRGITKKFVADALGRTQAICQDWKRGKSVPNDEQLRVVAEILGTSVDYLLCKTNDDGTKKPPAVSSRRNYPIKYDLLNDANRAIIDRLIDDLANAQSGD